MKSLDATFVELETHISGVVCVKTNLKYDHRGYFERLLCVQSLNSWNGRQVMQVNRTVTKKKGTIRGLHFQRPPFCECKFVLCLSGCVFDVILDLRAESVTYGNHFSTELGKDRLNGIIVPEGCAHGFQALTNDVEMIYFHSEMYSQPNEDGVNALDINLGIDWPISLTHLSEKDANLQPFCDVDWVNL